MKNVIELRGMKNMERDALFRLSKENVEWMKENYESLKREYDNRWIVIQDKKVVCSSSIFHEIMKAVQKYDTKTAVVEYIQSKPIAMFF